jgi:hypothetical protein
METKITLIETLEELQSVKKKVEELEIQVKRIKKEYEDTESFKEEYNALTTTAKRTHNFLTILILLSVAIEVILLLFGSGTLNSIFIIIFCGVTGSSISALTSSLERQANGWEFKDGLKYPEEEPKDKFSERMAPFFWYRPILGIVAAFLIFAMIKAGIIKLENITNYHLAFYTTLAGLFAKTLWEKLKDIFGSIVKIK